MPITWPQIGGFTFLDLQCDVDPDGKTVDEITRPAVDGVAYRQSGERGEESTLFGIAIVETSLEAKALINSYKALQTTLVTVTQSEQSASNYIVLRVERSGHARQCKTPVGGKWADGSAIDATSGWLVFSRWIVRYAGT